MTDKLPVTGEVAFDNTGARSTGAQRLSAQLSLASPLGLGDLLGAQLVHSTGSDYLRLGYSLPVGDDGWRVGVNASTLNYHVVSADLAALKIRGSSNALGIEASYPLLRSRLANVYLAANYDAKSFDNQANDATTTRYRIESATLGLSGNLFDTLGGGGANSANLGLVVGSRHNQHGSSDQHFSKLRYGFSRQQVIAPDISVLVSLSGQESNTKLDSSEKFYLGGSAGVRAYPSSEGGGNSGALAALELRWKMMQGLTLAAFHDAGQVRNSDASPSYGLKGWGLALAWQTASGISLRPTLSRRFGSNPNPTKDGIDQDGSLTRNRLWLQASLPL